MTLNGNSDETNGYNSVIKNGVVSNANLVKSVIPPIGAVISWLKSLTGCPALPDGWVECNGQTLSDSSSPFNGQVIPNLNGGTYRILRGASTSGSTGGSDTHNHKWSDGSNDNSATYKTFSLANDTTYSYDSSGNRVAINTDTSPNPDLLGTNYTSKDSSLPAYYEVVYIMRVK